MSAHNICSTCGIQFPATENPPEHCPICDDERQYIGWKGQRWTTLDDLRQKHHNTIRDDHGLIGIGTEPSFAIGQRALLVQSPSGNLLWDCITLLDGDTVDAVRKLGGIRAIAISHPHYYSSLVEWANAFDAPVLLHEADRQWVMRPDPRIEHWSGKTRELWDGMTLINAGGHFDGGTVLHWPGGAGGAGALLAGDIIQVAQDRRWVSFMYSFPNYVPLSARKVDGVVSAVEPFQFDLIYGAWWDRNVTSGAKDAVRHSADRYKKAISG
jgi:hypothetical protein